MAQATVHLRGDSDRLGARDNRSSLDVPLGRIAARGAGGIVGLTSIGASVPKCSMGKFKEAARELEAGEGEGRWEQRLKKALSLSRGLAADKPPRATALLLESSENSPEDHCNARESREQ